MNNTLTITSTQRAEPVTLTILHLAGRVDSANESQLREQAEQAHADGARRLLLDLGEVNYISSAGLRAIHIIFKLFTPAAEVQAWHPGGDVYKTPYFKIYCPSPQVYGVLNLAGFLHNIPFYTDLQEALDSFK